MTAPTHYSGPGNSHASVGYDPGAKGCRYVIRTGVHCGTQDTVTVDSVHGRRCAEHPPGYSTTHRARLLAAGDYTAAWAYLRTWIAAELAASGLPAPRRAVD